MRHDRSRFTKVSLYILAKILLNIFLFISAVIGWTLAILYSFPSKIDQGGNIFNSLFAFIAQDYLYILGFVIFYFIISLFITYFFFYQQFTIPQDKRIKTKFRTGRIIGDLVIKFLLLIIIMIFSFPVSSITTEILLNSQLSEFYEKQIAEISITDTSLIIEKLDQVNKDEESMQNNGVSLNGQDLHNIYIDKAQCEFAIVEQFISNETDYSEYIKKDVLSLSDIDDIYYIGNEKAYKENGVLPFILSRIFDVQITSDYVLLDNYSNDLHTCLSDVAQKDLATLGPIINEIAFRRTFEHINLSYRPEYFILNENNYIAKRNVENDKLLEEYDILIASNKEILNDINEFRADKDYTISILGQEYWNEFDEYMISVEDQANSNIEIMENIKNNIIESKEDIGAEAGIFIEPKTINIAYVYGDENNNRFMTIMHEYLHYASYITSQLKIDGKNIDYTNEVNAYAGDWNGDLLETYFEEAMTEILVNKMVESLNNNGYKTEIMYEIISQAYYPMTSLLNFTYVQDPELNESVYFSKDDGSLKLVFDTIYGEGYYQENNGKLITIFEKIYDTDPLFSDDINTSLREMGVGEDCNYTDEFGFSPNCAKYL